MRTDTRVLQALSRGRGCQPVRPLAAYRMAIAAPELSVVIPVYNEQEVLPALFARLYPALDALAAATRSCSSTTAAATARPRCSGRNSSCVRRHAVVLFSSNSASTAPSLPDLRIAGRYVITLDADLQNRRGDRLCCWNSTPARLRGTIRIERQDLAWRRYASRW